MRRLRRSRALLRRKRRIPLTITLWTNGLAAAFAGADADAVLQVEHEDLAVADLAGFLGAGGVDDGLDSGLDEGVVDGDLEFELGQELHLVFLAAVLLGVA